MVKKIILFATFGIISMRSYSGGKGSKYGKVDVLLTTISSFSEWPTMNLDFVLGTLVSLFRFSRRNKGLFKSYYL